MASECFNGACRAFVIYYVFFISSKYPYAQSPSIVILSIFYYVHLRRILGVEDGSDLSKSQVTPPI